MYKKIYDKKSDSEGSVHSTESLDSIVYIFLYFFMLSLLIF